MKERGFKIYAPEEQEPDKESDVFFNDKMIKNRDLSTAAAKIFRDQVELNEFRSCDALSASGIRGFRISDISDKVFFNDSNPLAVESIEKGLEANGIDPSKVELSNSNANVFLSDNKNLFHYIDIDPFGSFLEFLDSTARAANHQSFVGLTATDNAVTSGSYKKTCIRRYGSTPLKNSFMHETGLRIYLKETFENFARFDKEFDPKICWHERHYSRVSGRVTESKQRANNSTENIGYLSFCPKCRWRKLERKNKCGNCGNTDLKLAGPLWTGKFIDQRFTKKMKEKIPDSWEDSKQLLDRIDSEAELITPFYDLHELCSNIGISSPKREAVTEAIREKGYPVSRTHFSPTGFRTDAPIEDIKDIIKELN